jgi:hypothetical protein
VKAKHAQIAFVLDRSGSMVHHKQPTIDGFNEFLAGQKQVDGTCSVNLMLFDYPGQNHYVYQDMDIQKVEPLTDETFVPRGNTALIDAIGSAIDDLGIQLAAKPESERPEKVYVVILTDGEENASRDYDLKRESFPTDQSQQYKAILSQQFYYGQMTLPKRQPKGIVSEMIEHQKQKYGWQFIFIGADQDAIAVAQAMNIGAGQTIAYAANSLTANKHMYGSLTQNMASSRAAALGSDSATMNWSEEDRKKAVEPDAK